MGLFSYEVIYLLKSIGREGNSGHFICAVMENFIGEGKLDPIGVDLRVGVSGLLKFMKF